MSDRCHTHKARACQKCAGDAGGLTRTSALFVRHDDRCESEYDPSAHAWTPCGCWASRAEAEGLVAEVERLADVVAKVRQLADRWESVLRECKENDPRWILDQTVTTLETARWELCVALGQADLS